MSKLLKSSLVLLLVVLLGGCTVISFGQKGRNDLANWQERVAERELRYVHDFALFLIDSALTKELDSHEIHVAVAGNQAVLRFKNFDLSTLRFSDGKSLSYHWAQKHPSQELPAELQEAGALILTGYLDQSDGQMIAMRLFIEGTSVAHRSLLEGMLNRETGRFEGTVDGMGFTL